MSPLDPDPAIHSQGDACSTRHEQSPNDKCCAARVGFASLKSNTGLLKVPCADNVAPSSVTEPGTHCCGRVKPPSSCNSDTCDNAPGPASGDDQKACVDACCQDGPSASQSKAETTIDTVGCVAKESGLINPCVGSNLAGSEGCCSVAPSEGPAPTGEPKVADCRGGKPSPCCDSVSPSKGPAPSGEPKVADCCRGKPSPCCDESCLDRLALRECTGRAPAGENDDGCGSQRSSMDRKRNACDRHRLSARKRYGQTLEMLGCICRALIALGQESCCETRSRSSVERKSCSKRRSESSISASLVDSCCSPAEATSRHRLEPSSDGRCAKDPVKTSCCSSLEQSPKKATVPRRCSREKISSNVTCAPTPAGRTCAASCCASGESGTIKATHPVITNDPENQGIGSEHVVLCVSGMTCTGCETKLNRTLATVSGVKNLKTSLVLSRAEFDVDLTLVTGDDVIKHLERTTEFKCEKITSNGSSLDILVPGDVSAFINETWPAGVTDMTPSNKETVRLTFDPEMIGARDLLDKHFDNSVKLAPVRADPGLEAGRKHLLHIGGMTLLSAVLTIPVLVLAWAPLPERKINYGSASLALATIVQVFIAGPFYPKALKALIFSNVIEMDLLIVLSTSAAYVFSVVSFGYLVAENPLSTGQFFETSTLLVTLIMVGRYVAALARQKAIESVSIRSLQVSNTLLVDGVNASIEQEIDVRLLQYGDHFKVLPDSRIPTDGTVVAGCSEVDESMLTGESLPVEKRVQSRVIAGTINTSGSLIVRLTRLPGDNTVTTIAAMVDEAKLSKPKLQELADRVASYFVPVVIAVTAIVFVVWIAVGIAVQHKSGSAATVNAITYAITVLIVSCPCAIGLAVPMVVVIASGVAAERGVIFKSASAIEVAYKASHVVFDKTGTLTQGKLTVAKHMSNDDSSLGLLLGLIGDSRHPVSIAVASHLRNKGVTAAVVPQAKSLTGRGLQAELGGQTLRAGNSRWLALSSHATVEPVLAQNHTAFCFTIDDKLVAVFGLEDTVRPDAVRVVSELHTRGIMVHLVSGDDDGPVKDVAAQLNIPTGNIHARCSPADKQVYIKGLLDHPVQGKSPTVIFCGDGTNDAVALAQATIGVHMHEGSDVAQSAADVVLMRPELAGILTIIDTSKQSVNRIKFNFAWSFVYNVFAILLAAGAFVNARIPPEFAGLGELVSVLPIIAAAVLLRWSRN